MLVRPESLGPDDKGQCARTWRLASLLASHLTSDQDGVFGPIFLFGASLAPGVVGIPKRRMVVATSCQQRPLALTCVYHLPDISINTPDTL